NSISGLNDPIDVSFNARRDLYITDKAENAIKIYDQKLGWKKSIKADFIRKPSGIIVVDPADTWHYYKEGFIVFINKEGTELVKMSLDNSLLKSLDVAGVAGRNVKLEYLTADYYSQILVTDSLNSTIHKFDRDLNYVTSFGRYGADDYEFIKPTGIDIWRRFGQIFVTEETGGQYYWTGIDIKDLKVRTTASNCRVSYRLTEPAIMNMALFEKKRLVRTVQSNVTLLRYQNQFTFPWPAQAEKKEGKGYTLKISATATYSSRKVFRKVIEKKL
ncbi:MAG: hypothetical protein PHF84_09075, partial [bacterium]|nr:hypothetical protein [bacterium]